jgi:hypothetical protein
VVYHHSRYITGSLTLPDNLTQEPDPGFLSRAKAGILQRFSPNDFLGTSTISGPRLRITDFYLGGLFLDLLIGFTGFLGNDYGPFSNILEL